MTFATQEEANEALEGASLTKTTTLRERFDKFAPSDGYEPLLAKESVWRFLENEVQGAEKRGRVEGLKAEFPEHMPDVYQMGKADGYREAVERCVLPEANKTKITWDTDRLTTDAFIEGYNYYRYKILEIAKHLKKENE